MQKRNWPEIVNVLYFELSLLSVPHAHWTDCDIKSYQARPDSFYSRRDPATIVIAYCIISRWPNLAFDRTIGSDRTKLRRPCPLGTKPVQIRKSLCHTWYNKSKLQPHHYAMIQMKKESQQTQTHLFHTHSSLLRYPLLTSNPLKNTNQILLQNVCI
jgi:hypothetical protein